jgi:hypothetical protein
MAFQTSDDGRFIRNDNYPPLTWACKDCWSLVMVGNRTAHKKWHDEGLGKSEFGREGFGT